MKLGRVEDVPPVLFILPFVSVSLKLVQRTYFNGVQIATQCDGEAQDERPLEEKRTVLPYLLRIHVCVKSWNVKRLDGPSMNRIYRTLLVNTNRATSPSSDD